jgi:hypothetical protein
VPARPGSAGAGLKGGDVECSVIAAGRRRLVGRECFIDNAMRAIATAAAARGDAERCRQFAERMRAEQTARRMSRSVIALQMQTYMLMSLINHNRNESHYH